jgi:hypothetical protein
MGNLLLTLTLALGTFQNGDFASNFFGDLGRLFGKLQQSELARAFEHTSTIRDLGNSGYYILSDGKEASSSVKLQFKLEK